MLLDAMPIETMKITSVTYFGEISFTQSIPRYNIEGDILMDQYTNIVRR